MSNEHQHCWHAAELNALPQRRLFVVCCWCGLMKTASGDGQHGDHA